MKRSLPKTGEKYIHYATKEAYTIVFISVHTEQGVRLVNYMDNMGKGWSRPLDMFMGTVITNIGTPEDPEEGFVFRFEKIKE